MAAVIALRRRRKRSVRRSGEFTMEGERCKGDGGKRPSLALKVDHKP